MTDQEDKCLSIRRILSRETGIPLDRITPASRLAEDLHMDGDDASDFFERFFDRFQVDASEFRFEKFFGQEAGALFPVSVLVPAFRKSVTITVRDLVQAAESARWRDPYPVVEQSNNPERGSNP